MDKSIINILDRMRFSLPWALRHLVVSLMVGGVLAFLVLKIWFPQPFFQISGGWKLFFLIVFVDVICGPVLTLLLIHPEKSRSAKWVDITLIAAVQMGALIYGVYSLSQARPIALVFEVDRFRVVSYADIDTSRPEIIPEWVGPMSFESPRLLGVRNAKNSQEKMESVDASLQGIEPSQRPDWWQDYQLNVPQIKSRAMPLDSLLAANPQLAQRIKEGSVQAAKKTHGLRPEQLRWLPVVSRMTMDWVAFVDPNNGQIQGYVQADGFAQ